MQNNYLIASELLPSVATQLLHNYYLILHIIIL